MGRFGHIVVTILLFIFTLQMPSITSAANVPKAYINFVATSCKTTTYASLCYQSLSPYAASIKTSRLKLSYVALSVTIKAARTTSALISSLAKNKGLTRLEAAVIRDCIENVEDSVDQLKQTLGAMAKLRGKDRKFQLSNAKTWASAAITNEYTCIDAFSGGKVSASMRNRVRNSLLNVTRLNSNALYLINRM